MYVCFSSVVPEYSHLRDGGMIRLFYCMRSLSSNLGLCMSSLCTQSWATFSLAYGLLQWDLASLLVQSEWGMVVSRFLVDGNVGATVQLESWYLVSPGYLFWSCVYIQSLLYAINLYVKILKQHWLEGNALPFIFKACLWVRIGIVEYLRTVVEGLNPSHFSHRTTENSGSSRCTPLKEGCCISKVHHTAHCHDQPTLWSVVMGSWVGKPEWMIRSVKLAFAVKGIHVLLTGYQCSLPETWE